jgi:hypothetical protein
MIPTNRQEINKSLASRGEPLKYVETKEKDIDTTQEETLDDISIEGLQNQVKDLSQKLADLYRIVQEHNHTGKDGTGVLENGLNLRPSEKIQMGNFRLEETTNLPSGSVKESGYLIVGKDKDDFVNSDNMNVVFDNISSTNANGGARQSFIMAQRYPLIIGYHASVTSGASTLATNEHDFEDDSLVGAQLWVSTAGGASFESRMITANIGNTITVEGTWGSTRSNVAWTVFMPVYLGAANFSWRQVYIGGDDVSSGGTGAQRRAIKLGHNATTDSQGIYFGSGTPESVVTAVVGSLYLRSDGSTSTTLYVKTSGSGNTGWTAK